MYARPLAGVLVHVCIAVLLVPMTALIDKVSLYLSESL